MPLSPQMTDAMSLLRHCAVAAQTPPTGTSPPCAAAARCRTEGGHGDQRAADQTTQDHPPGPTTRGETRQRIERAVVHVDSPWLVFGAIVGDPVATAPSHTRR